ncbi:hypothetical protein COCCADRAFT_111540 [Bipolaris zeicola 26-R-13]|uniref:Uncharacterized protein n=1 Tax=Cochliobolus carbonum (strain 26-R-13) TaxID=930089 RepID=W6XJX4_COCC2|nr:uncharacterized protein COCCADRAFT_111540 [Bipolaris zeicola 26-R-13]EUC27497.1 hypothetical protein COCCADRAFT_111540 [Bipolaris zeicola 26-R-13]
MITDSLLISCATGYQNQSALHLQQEIDRIEYADQLTAHSTLPNQDLFRGLTSNIT